MKTGVLRIIVLYVMYAFWLGLISDSYFRCTLVDISRNVYDHVRTNVHYADKCTGATTSIAVINSFVQIQYPLDCASIQAQTQQFYSFVAISYICVLHSFVSHMCMIPFSSNIFICTSQPQNIYEIMPLWTIQTTKLDPIFE